MSYSKKIAAATVQNRTQTPFWNWLRNKLLAVDRQPVTPPPGLPTPDGKAVYHNPLRFPNTQSTRSPDPPSLPGGVHHQLADNYYKDRDGRRTVKPPAAIYAADATGVTLATVAGDTIEASSVSGVSIGPGENFGLETPTPGNGIEWSRNKKEELDTQKMDPQTNMHTTVIRLGKHFGNLGKMYGEYRFALSPNEQKAFKGFFDHAFLKVFKNYVWLQWYYYVPQTVAAYLIYDWAKKTNYKAGRKNPADYANDQ